MRRLTFLFVLIALTTVFDVTQAQAGNTGNRGETTPATLTIDGAEAVAAAYKAGSGRSSGAGASKSGDEESPWEGCFVESLDDLDESWFEGGTERLGALRNLSLREKAWMHVFRSDGEYGDATAWAWCRGRDGESHAQWLVRPQEPADLVPALLVSAREALVLPVPDVGMSPPVDAAVLPVGLPVWFWVENFSVVAETASAPGVSVTVEGRPVETVVRVVEPWMTDGRRESRTTVIECSGAGEVFDPTHHGDWATSNCSHVFRWAGDAEVEVSVRWDLGWSSTTGQSGNLGTIERRTSFDLQPVGMEAVTH